MSRVARVARTAVGSGGVGCAGLQRAEGGRAGPGLAGDGSARGGPVRRAASGGRGTAAGEPDVATVLDLVAAACAAGASIPGALLAVGAALPGAGRSLVRAGTALGVGAGWDAAWPDGGPVCAALRPAWEDGSAPGPALRAAAETARRDRHTRALEAAGRLGVRLVLPLGLCYLPAFVLVGLVPVLVSMASGDVG